MKTQVSPAVAAIVILVVAVAVGAFMWSRASGKSFTKSEASRKMGGNIDMNKVVQDAAEAGKKAGMTDANQGAGR